MGSYEALHTCAGPESERCLKLIEAHKQCLRAEGFNVRPLAPVVRADGLLKLQSMQGYDGAHVRPTGVGEARPYQEQWPAPDGEQRQAARGQAAGGGAACGQGRVAGAPAGGVPAAGEAAAGRPAAPAAPGVHAGGGSLPCRARHVPFGNTLVLHA